MNLIGSWEVDQADRRARAELGDVRLEFDEDSGLRYIIRSDDKQQIILLRYEVEGSMLITDQPSAPRIERTAFSISDDGLLILEYGGQPYRFRRQL